MASALQRSFPLGMAGLSLGHLVDREVMKLIGTESCLDTVQKERDLLVEWEPYSMVYTADLGYHELDTRSMGCIEELDHHHADVVVG